MNKLSQAVWLLVQYAKRSEASSEDVERDAQRGEVDVKKAVPAVASR